MPDILGIAALAVAVTALAVSACCVAATRWLLQRILATLSQPPQFTRKLTPAEERKLRADFASYYRGKAADRGQR